MDTVNKESAIRALVRQAVASYASGFSDRHLSEVDDSGASTDILCDRIGILTFIL